MVAENDQEMNEFERSLRSLRPSAAGLSSDRLIYEAGQRRGRRSRGSLFIPWSIAAVSLCLTAVLAQNLRIERRMYHELSTAIEAQSRRLQHLEGRTEAIAVQVKSDPSSSDSFARLRAAWYTRAPPNSIIERESEPIPMDPPSRSLPLSPRRSLSTEL